METTDDKPMTDDLPPYFGKPQYRDKMRGLSWPEKVRIVVELQKMVAPILRARGEKPFVWQIENTTPQELGVRN